MARISTGKCLAFIVGSIVLSWILAVTVNLDKYELGAVFNLFLPPLVGVTTIILFLIFNAIFKNSKIQVPGLVICCLINLYIGVVFHFELSCLPFGR